MTDTAGQVPVRLRLPRRPVLAAVQGRRVPLPARVQVRQRLLHPAALRQRDCPTRTEVRRGERLLRRPLQGVTCASPKICMLGRCLDCNDPALACTGAKICVAGVCKTDKCKDVSCPTTRTARRHLQRPLHPRQVRRGTALRGRQVPPRHVRQVASARPSQFCNPTTGACETDRCIATQCGAGMSCVSRPTPACPTPADHPVPVRVLALRRHQRRRRHLPAQRRLQAGREPRSASAAAPRAAAARRRRTAAVEPAWLSLLGFASAGPLARRRRRER